MLAKVLIICAVATATLATEYPEDVDPVACPNYPFCDGKAKIPAAVIPVPLYGLPYTARAAHHFGYRALHPALCPNFPDCDPEVLRRHTPEGIPIPEWELPKYIPFYPSYRYPAGINPLLCPFYPYCDMELLTGHKETHKEPASTEAPAE